MALTIVYYRLLHITLVFGEIQLLIHQIFLFEHHHFKRLRIEQSADMFTHDIIFITDAQDLLCLRVYLLDLQFVIEHQYSIGEISYYRIGQIFHLAQHVRQTHRYLGFPLDYRNGLFSARAVST